jgi:hypothetical protein
MPLVPGLPLNIRQTNGGAPPAISPGLSIKHDVHNPPGVPEMDDAGAVIKIEHPDGSVTVSLDGRSLVDKPEQNVGWFANLAEKIKEDDLSAIADDLLRGIDEDLSSRNDWIEERAQGIKLLGFKIEIPNLQSAADGAPVDGMSKVRHPLLQEAVLRFQANARSEMLPTDGPIKIRDDGSNSNLPRDALATALEKDLNHYLTVTATEYYPDTDKMFLLLGFGGTAFKKVYNCPLRNRPVSESVDANDLIVNDAATDLANAKRVTHRSMMRPSTVKRMQIIGAYRDVDLDTPKPQSLDAAQEAAKNQQGIQATTTRPDDRDREIYECYCELDLKGYEHKYKGKITGLEIPYRVTIDLSSRKILSIVRNYDEDTKELPEARETFVKYIFVPGLGFYDIGLLHILGNTTNAVTAAWRELLDAGMFNNFPGFLMADTGARQNTNIFRVPPGGGVLVKTGGLPISQAIMPLPYQPPSQALMALVQDMAQTGQRSGGTAELPTGEGKADIPVGTILAMIEQAQKVLNNVHKRMHSAQSQEFRLLIRCFKENPKAFWQRNKKPSAPWDEQNFRAALDLADLTPQADPNTASHGQRVMKIMALKQLQQQNPTMYDPIAIDTAALQALGWNNPQQFMAPPAAQAAPPPQIVQQQAETAAKTLTAQAAMVTAQAKAKESGARAMNLMAEAQTMGMDETGQVQQDTPVDQHRAESERIKANAHAQQADTHQSVMGAKAQADLLNAQTRQQEVQLKLGEMSMKDAHHDDEQRLKTRAETIDMAKQVMDSHAENARTQEEMHHDHALMGREQAHEHEIVEKTHAHEKELEGVKKTAAIAVAKAKPRPKPAAKPKGKSK